MSKYEPMFYGWVDEHHNFYGGNSCFDIWDISRTSKNDLHPTMKPIELCAKGIMEGSKTNNSVLDLFGGSGSTMMACEQLNRVCYMMELDAKYCEVICRRWEKLTGKTRELLN
jgi:DNA modification methylase